MWLREYFLANLCAAGTWLFHGAEGFKRQGLYLPRRQSVAAAGPGRKGQTVITRKAEMWLYK